MSATPATAFKTAFATGDFAPAARVLADDVVFGSPVLATPWTTKPVLERLGPAMVAVLEDIVFTATIEDRDRAVIVFTARQGDVDVEGVQLLESGADGLVARMAIFLRPLPAVAAVARAMQRLVDPELLAGHPG